jgi:hypothetical protein
MAGEGLNWQGLLRKKYEIAQQDVDANSTKADADMVQANAYQENVGNEYDIAKQRFYPQGLEERKYIADNANTLRRTGMETAGLATLRDRTGQMCLKQGYEAQKHGDLYGENADAAQQQFGVRSIINSNIIRGLNDNSLSVGSSGDLIASPRTVPASDLPADFDRKKNKYR